MENKYNIYNTISREIIGAAIEVHKELGSGLLECVYETCLVRELHRKGLEVKSQVTVPLFHKGERMDNKVRLRFLWEAQVVV